jgi:hypothetical protein
MTATTLTSSNSAVRTERTERSAASSRQLRRSGAVAGAAAAVATVGVAAAANAAGVPIEIGGEAIPLAGFAQLTMFATVIGVVMASVMSRRADRPRHTFVSTTLALTALSFVPDVLADAQTATKLTLVLTHIVAATIVIPALSSRLAD